MKIRLRRWWIESFRFVSDITDCFSRVEWGSQGPSPSRKHFIVDSQVQKPCHASISLLVLDSAVLEFILSNSTFYFMFFSIQSDNFKINEQLIFSKINILPGIMIFKVQRQLSIRSWQKLLGWSSSFSQKFVCIL